jgi:hypothetical protein
MKNIYEVLKEKEKEYAAAVTQWRNAQSVATRLSQEVDSIKSVIRMLSEAQDQTVSEQTDLSQPQMVRLVLLQNNSEMHLREIINTVKERFGKALTPTVLGAVLFRYAKRGSMFYKAPKKPNTWGLLEWRSKDPQQSVMEIVEKVQ